MTEKRVALIIASYKYRDAGLQQLIAPAQDAEGLARVLKDPAIGDFEVQTLLNERSHEASQQIEDFFNDRKHDDLLLFYFSGHGIKDEQGRLYFATSDTQRKRLRTTAIPAALVNDVMRSSRSRRQVLLLDCCYSGAFARGMVAKAADQVIGIRERFEGRGRVLLTASDAMQYAFEGDKIEGEGVRSIFTRAVVEGLKTGQADLDEDGDVSFDELCDYVYSRVVDETPQQEPCKFALDVRGKIVIARNPRLVAKAARLLPELWSASKNRYPDVRAGAVQSLEPWLSSSDRFEALAARQILERLMADADRRVSSAAARALGVSRPDVSRSKKTKRATRKPIRPETTRSARKERSSILDPPDWLVELTSSERESTAAPSSGRSLLSRIEKAKKESIVDPSTDGYIPGWLAEMAPPEKKPVSPRKPFEPEMILIPAGEFLMGSDPQKGKGAYGDEQPQHTLHLPDYYLARTPLTNAQYLPFVQATGRDQPRHWKGGQPPKGKGKHPVVNVSWNDAVAYCNWLAEVTGKPYRLPSEAEWEKGARGTDGRIYPWGNRWDAKLCNTSEGGKKDTPPVGVYPQGASPYGLLDMAGNVWEWTSSLFQSYPYRADDGREDPDSSARRVVRGGSFKSDRRRARCASRNHCYPHFHLRNDGFRVAAAPFSLPPL